MKVLVHYKTDSEKKAFMCGLAFYLGYLKASNKKLAFDANTNNPYWVTTENGHHFLIDEEGTIQSGRFKNQPIDTIKHSWNEINSNKEQKQQEEKFYQTNKLGDVVNIYQKGKFYSDQQMNRIRAYINEHKHEERMPDNAIHLINNIVEHKNPTDNELAARPVFEQSLNNQIKNQSPEIQEHINNFKINHNGMTEVPFISNQLKQIVPEIADRKIVVPLLTFKREVGKHRDLTEETFTKGVALSVMGENLEVYKLKSNKDNYLRLGIRILNKTFGDFVMDLEDKNDHIDIVHFFRNKEKNIKKDLIE